MFLGNSKKNNLDKMSLVNNIFFLLHIHHAKAPLYLNKKQFNEICKLVLLLRIY